MVAPAGPGVPTGRSGPASHPGRRPPLLCTCTWEVRLAHGRQPEPTAGIIGPQGVRGADTVPCGSRGYDAGKKINGRKGLIVTDTLGRLVTVWVLAASWQDRDGAKGALLATYAATPIRHVFADSGFAGRLVDWARDLLRTTVEIVRKPADQQVFVMHPRRWGCRTGPGLDHRPPPPGPRLRNPPPHLRGHDPKGRARRHASPSHPQQTRQSPTTPLAPALGRTSAQRWRSGPALFWPRCSPSCRSSPRRSGALPGQGFSQLAALTVRTAE
ncbi:transposase [Micromonospora peucetia]|uniref:transposase n=1 Tax=Micromonospora peucetia TaxID=47871 RepID=UPI000B859D3D